MLTTPFKKMKLVIYVAKIQQILFFVHQIMMNVNFSIGKFVLWKCTACTSIALPGVERDPSNQAPMITFNTYMTQFTCSHHGIVIRERITTYLDTKVTSKKTFFLYEQLIQANTPYFTHGRLYVIVKLFSVQCKIGDFHKDS